MMELEKLKGTAAYWAIKELSEKVDRLQAELEKLKTAKQPRQARNVQKN